MILIMRKLLLIIGFAGTLFSGRSQELERYPPYPVPEKYRLKGAAGLPSKVDNSQKVYFPFVFDQYGYSCNQASSIGYVFNYEINRLRDMPSRSPENIFTPGFVWNLLNSSQWGVGVSYFDSWEIVKAAGCANSVDYPFYHQGAGIWMSGYDKYYRAMQNRISVNYSMPVGTPEGLTIFKRYLFDHLEDSPHGGLASFQIASEGMLERSWVDPETQEQWPVLWSFGTNVGHALTFVGYNDSVRLDLNRDGKFTNNLDINNDGTVDMQDWEVGALLAVNSWGQNFWKGGKVYVLYSVVAREGHDGGIWNRSVHVAKAMKYYNPELTMRVAMRHEQRNRFRILAGFSTDTTATRPQKTLSFPIFNHQGDRNPLQDPENTEDDRRFEFGLDITPLISDLEPGVPVRFFLVVEEDDPNDVAEGRIDEFSVIHYFQGTTEEISRQKNVPVVNDGSTYVSLTKTLNFNKLKVEKPAITNVTLGEPFYAQLDASGGQPPYRWELVKDYQEKTYSLEYEGITGDTLSDYNNEVPFRRINLPFEFPFYGTQYKSLVADINGALHFENEYFQYPYAIMEDLVFKVRKSIVPFGADIQVNVPGDMLLYQASDSVVTFEWRASVYREPVVYPLKVKASLHSDGRIEFFYGNRSVPAKQDYPWQVGLSNGDGYLYKYASISDNQLMFEDYGISFSPLDYPQDIVLTEDGTLSGVANEDDHLWNVLVKVTDSYNQVKYASVPVSTITRDTVSFKSRNFPNPFTRTTGISFSVADELPVVLDIYDFSGRKVMELINKTLLPGDFTIYWNARDRSNRDVKPGTYIYQLRIGNHKESGKMILVR
jgi:hypothetical protein